MSGKFEGIESKHLGEEYQWDANQLIDLFVHMNFEDIESPLRLAQFRMLAEKVGYPISMIDRVVELGKTEYEKLLTELITVGHPFDLSIKKN